MLLKFNQALLSLRADEGGLAAPMQVDRPEEGDVVRNQKGFYYEIGKNALFDETGDTSKLYLLDLELEEDSAFDYGKVCLPTLLNKEDSSSTGRGRCYYPGGDPQRARSGPQPRN